MPGQFAQAEAPAPAAKVPAGHKPHALAAKVVEYLPAGQGAHAVAPATADTVPAAQLRQLDDGDDDASDDVNTPEYLPARQAEQADAAADELTPTAHEVHAVTPAAAAYCPAVQLEQPDAAEVEE